MFKYQGKWGRKEILRCGSNGYMGVTAISGTRESGTGRVRPAGTHCIKCTALPIHLSVCLSLDQNSSYSVRKKYHISRTMVTSSLQFSLSYDGDDPKVDLKG